METIKASEWHNNLDSGGKILLEKMIVDFSLQGVKAKTVIKLIAHKFNISLQLARDFFDLRRKAKSSPVSDLKKNPKMPVNSAARLAQWEKKAIFSNHNYGDEIFTRLLYEEKKAKDEVACCSRRCCQILHLCPSKAKVRP